MGVELTDDAAGELDKLLGEVLANRYRVEAKLGEGAMGAVYRARHVKVGRPFAVKVLHPRLLEDRKTLLRFEREAELAGRLRHPNVIGVVDVGETPDGLRYMVMDYADGPDLAHLLGEAPMRPQRIVHLTRQILEGLFHAHEAGLIHRDFKPENVIVERDSHDAEVPRIVDFGIAILRDGGDSSSSPGRLTTNGLVLGTPHYMAPEQAVADPVDHRIDLFALGIVIYEMLSGRLPFDGSGAEVARANLLLDPPPISARVPFLEVDPLLEAFARRLMAKKRDARPPTAKAARDLLDLIEHDRAAAAAALGVPLVARPPLTTLPTSPLATFGSTAVVPDSHDLSTPRQIPPMVSAVAVAVPPSVSERHVETQLAEPIADPPPRSRRPLILGGIVAATMLGVVAIVVAMGSGDAAKRDANGEPQVAMTVTLPEVTKEPTTTPTTPTPTPPPPTPTKVEPRATEVEPEQAPTAEDPPAKVATPQTTQAPIAHPSKQPRPAKQPGKAAKPEPALAVQPAQRTEPPRPTPVEVKAPDRTAQRTTTGDGPLDAGALAARYKSVGGELRALEQTKGAEVAHELWNRYRRIQLGDAMTTPEKRAGAAALLAQLHAEAIKLR